MILRKILPLLRKEMISDKIIVLTGMRRTGKTTLANHLYETSTNVSKIFLDLENPLNQSYFTLKDYDAIYIHLKRLAIGTSKNLLVILDEIQNVPNLPSVVKYLYDHYQIKFVLTGSASFYLKHLFSESLSGRKRIFELFPFDFEEFLSYKAPNFKKPSIDEKISQPLFLLLEKYIYEYFMYGGFPSVILKPSHDEKIKEIQDIFTSYYQKEVLLISDFRKHEVMKSIINLLLTRVGNKIDIAKIAIELGVTRATVSEYLDFLENTYLIKRVGPYSSNLDVAIRGQKKLYIVDNGFLTMIDGISKGAMLENGVFNLLRSWGDRYYYQTNGGAEIDFIVKNRAQLTAFEVKNFAKDTDVNKLKKLTKNLNIDKYFIVSQRFALSPKTVFPFQI